MKQSRRILVSTDIRVCEDRRRYYTRMSSVGYENLKRYLGAYDRVRLLARRSEGSDDWIIPVDGLSVEVTTLSDYHGAAGIMRALAGLAAGILRAGDRHDTYFVRVPEPVSLLTGLVCVLRRGTLIVNVVADPGAMVFVDSTGVKKRLFSLVSVALSRFLIWRADGVVYVTMDWLQSKYPAKRGVPTLARSNVALTEDAFRSPEQVVGRRAGPIRLISIGQMNTSFKGFDVAIRAVGSVRKHGTEAELTLVGDGILRGDLETLVEGLGLRDVVHFAGYVAEPVVLRQYLDRADVYLSTSRSEGLPRAVIEAMARSIPVIATDAGGSRELVAAEWVVPIDDVEAVAVRVLQIAGNRAVAQELSADSYRRAQLVAESAKPENLHAFFDRVCLHKAARHGG